MRSYISTSVHIPSRQLINVPLPSCISTMLFEPENSDAEGQIGSLKRDHCHQLLYRCIRLQETVLCDSYDRHFLGPQRVGSDCLDNF